MRMHFCCFVAIAGLLASGCTGARSTGDADKVIKSTRSGDLTITLASQTGDLKNSDNELALSFADASGNLVDVGAASLKFHMPAMGSMPAMEDVAALTTTDIPGKYRAKVNIEMAGTWEAFIVYQGPLGTGSASMTVNAR